MFFNLASLQTHLNPKSIVRLLHQIELSRYSLLLLTLFIISWISTALGGFSYTSFYTQWLEIPLVLYIYAVFFHLQRHSRWRAVIAALPIILFYLVHDGFFLAYSKVFRWINAHELPELLQVLPWHYSIVVSIILFIPPLILLYLINLRPTRTRLLLILPALSFLLFLFIAPAEFEKGFRLAASEVVKYSDAKSVERNGRLAMTLLREAERLQVTRQMSPYRDRTAYDNDAHTKAAYLQKHGNKQNVHLIVLESFLDPTLFYAAKFSQAPAHPDFTEFFKDSLGLSIAPMFGGATSQSEFEVLCGVPGFEKLSSIEFNVFTGAPAFCLPGVLALDGYRTIGANAYKPNFFNALTAYKGIGFSELHFPREFYAGATYLSTGDVGVEEFQFDADLFSQNLAMVRRARRDNPAKPLFNYLMTIYGHTPHLLDPQQRPEFIKVIASSQDDHFIRSTNQFYYRTKAIADFVKELIKIDKQSLIILVADHVPPLRYGPNTFNELRYLDNIERSYYHNRIMIIENGSPKKYPVLHHYDMPDVIQNYLTNGQYCQTQPCFFQAKTSRPARDTFTEAYLRLLAHASE